MINLPLFYPKDKFILIPKLTLVLIEAPLRLNILYGDFRLLKKDHTQVSMVTIRGVDASGSSSVVIMWWWTLLESALLCASFTLAVLMSYLLLLYLESKPSGRKSLMDELNRNVLHGFILMVLSNYPLTLIITLKIDLIEPVAAIFAVTRYTTHIVNQTPFVNNRSLLL